MEAKNLFDIGNQIENGIRFIQNNDETIMSAEMNQYTKDYLKKYNIYGIKNIPIIINDNLNNFIIKFNREKKIESTDYVPYEYI